MKKILIFLLLFISYSLYSNDLPKVAWVNTSSGLNLREAPNLKSRIITMIPYNSKINILEYYSYNTDIINGIEDYWVKIKYLNKIGWVFAGYLSYDSLLTDSDYNNIIKRISNMLNNSDQRIASFFKKKLQKVDSYNIELSKLFNTAKYGFKNKYGETYIGNNITIRISIVRFNKTHKKIEKGYEEIKWEVDYINFLTDYIQYINSNENSKIGESLADVILPVEITSFKKKVVENNNYIEVDAFFQPAGCYIKMVLFATDNYLIICSLDLYQHSITITHPFNETKDWFYKSNLFYIENVTHEIKLTPEGKKYLYILEEVMIELIDIASRY